MNKYFENVIVDGLIMRSSMLEREIQTGFSKESELKLDVAKGDEKLGEVPNRYYANTPDGRGPVNVFRIDDGRDLVRISYCPGIGLPDFTITVPRPKTIPPLQVYGSEEDKNL